MEAALLRKRTRMGPRMRGWALLKGLRAWARGVCG